MSTQDNQDGILGKGEKVLRQVRPDAGLTLRIGGAAGFCRMMRDMQKGQAA